MARHRVQVLREAGMTLRRIAAETGISHRSVKRIAREDDVERPALEGQARVRGVGRPSVVEGWRDRVAAVLAAEPGLPTVEILHRLSYRGGKSALYELVRGLRPKLATPMVRFEGLPGEFSQHDFGQAALDYRFAPECARRAAGRRRARRRTWSGS